MRLHGYLLLLSPAGLSNGLTKQRSLEPILMPRMNRKILAQESQPPVPPPRRFPSGILEISSEEESKQLYYQNRAPQMPVALFPLRCLVLVHFLCFHLTAQVGNGNLHAKSPL
ncbi:unnamed protein product [Thelazia callipaeda]|uniref:ZM domain-containing protein n=1 Tax=Thelazia callipaeda TaxID=103827 RepID=A0A0N5CSK7_THECL|nr:unnamed protein product [Thelazia callipaeda]